MSLDDQWALLALVGWGEETGTSISMKLLYSWPTCLLSRRSQDLYKRTTIDIMEHVETIDCCKLLAFERESTSKSKRSGTIWLTSPCTSLQGQMSTMFHPTQHPCRNEQKRGQQGFRLDLRRQTLGHNTMGSPWFLLHLYDNWKPSGSGGEGGGGRLFYQICKCNFIFYLKNVFFNLKIENKK